MKKALIQRKEVFSFIEEKFKTAFDEQYRDGFIDKVKKFIYAPNLDQTEEMKDHITWIKNNHHLKMNSYQVPQNIISNKDNSVLHDIKVQSKGPDDYVFDQNPDIRAKIARGNTILETSLDNGKKQLDLIIYALRKFSGGLGDEDSVDRNKNDWKNYFLKDIEATKYVISLRKANGEAAHMSCRFINDEFVLFVGSKNVHLAFKTKNDLLLYGEARFGFAKIIAEAVLTHMNKMSSDNKNLFLSFLCWTKFTVIFELLNPKTQHVEDLSYLEEPLLKFLTFTDNKLIDKPETLCCLPPEVSIEIGKLFGFSCVDCTKIPYSEVDEYLLEVRKEHGYEGVVLYFLDSDLNVIGLLKKKTVWYIIVRALREKIRSYINSKQTYPLEDLKKKVNKRLGEIQRWICFTNTGFQEWTDLSLKFLDWFDTAYSTNQIRREDFSDTFPVIWNKFLNQSNLNDKIELII